MKHGQHEKRLGRPPRERVAYFYKASKEEIMQKRRAIWRIVKADEQGHVVLECLEYQHWYLTFNRSHPCKVKWIPSSNWEKCRENFKWIIEKGCDEDSAGTSAVYIRPYISSDSNRIFHLKVSSAPNSHAKKKASIGERGANRAERMKAEFQIIPLEVAERKCLICTVINNSEIACKVSYKQGHGISYISGESLTLEFAGSIQSALEHTLGSLTSSIRAGVQRIDESLTESKSSHDAGTGRTLSAHSTWKLYQECYVYGPYRIRLPAYTSVIKSCQQV